MTDKLIEASNVTATEIANAKHPDAPVHGVISDMVDREIAALRDLSSDKVMAMIDEYDALKVKRD